MDNITDKKYTLNYILKFINGMFSGREKKEHIKPFEYLSKYTYVLNDIINCSDKNHERSGIIWQCWWQGEENMPNLVKTCTSSVKKYNPESKVVIITEKNYKDYISLPEYVLEKHKRGIIPMAQLSDIIRLMLLVQYGGIWIDSTILETGVLPKEAFSLDFFTYKNTQGLCFEYIKTFNDLEIMCNHLNSTIMLPSTWFISSCSNNIIVSGWLKLLLEYWKYENILIDYFIMDYFFVLMLLNNRECRQIFSNLPNYLTTPVNILQSAMPEEYNETTFERIKAISPIHKLTLKYTPDGSITNRFYNEIIK